MNKKDLIGTARVILIANCVNREVIDQITTLLDDSIQTMRNQFSLEPEALENCRDIKGLVECYKERSLHDLVDSLKDVVTWRRFDRHFKGDTPFNLIGHEVEVDFLKPTKNDLSST